MAEVSSPADRFTEARVRAFYAIRRDPWHSFRLSCIAFVGSLAAGGAVLQGLAAAKSLAPGTGWYVIGLFATAFPFSFLGLELLRLIEKASALKELYEAQREWEDLLLRAEARRDEAEERVAALLHENNAIRSLVTLVGLARAARVREDTQA